MRYTAAGDVLLRPVPLNAAGGVPAAGLRVIARLDGAIFKDQGLVVEAHCFNQQAKAPKSQIQYHIHMSLMIHCGCVATSFYFMPAILELNLCSLFFFCSFLFDLATGVNPPHTRNSGWWRDPGSNACPGMGLRTLVA